MDIEYLSNRELGEMLSGLEEGWYQIAISKEFAKEGLNHPFFKKLKEVRAEAARRFLNDENDGDKDQDKQP